MKRQLTEWEKIFASHVSEKGLMSKKVIFKNPTTQNKKNYLIEKWAEGLHRHFFHKKVYKLPTGI